MPTIAIVFPGQGSQSPGMLDAWNSHPAVQATIQEASDALHEDLGRLIREGSKETLSLTSNTQPVMLVAGVAAYRVWLAEGGPIPSVVAGHSLGEYSALVAAQVLSLAQAAPLVRLRGQAMQEAVPVGSGAMAAVLGLAAEAVVQICKQVTADFVAQGAGEVVEAVNFNDPLQTVIAGNKAAVEQASVRLKEHGAKRVLPLPVSAPFHSTLMRPAAEKLALALAEIDIRPPQIPVLNNIDVQIQSDAAAIRNALYRQAFGPVRWVECMLAIEKLGVGAVLESGPGKVLSGMAKRICPALPSAPFFDPTSLAECLALTANTGAAG